MEELVMRRIVITACPYSATKHTALLLRKLDLDIGHELYGADGIVSWQHTHMSKADFIAEGFAPDVALLHQVRHPLMVISSLRQLNAGSQHPRTKENIWRRIKAMTQTMAPEWDIESDPPPLYMNPGLLVWMRLWYWWNRRGAEKADGVYRVEELPDRWEWFLDELGLDSVVMPKIRKTNNRHRNSQVLSWDELYAADPDLTLDILDLAAEFGYNEVPEDYLGDEFYEFPERIELSTRGSG